MSLLPFAQGMGLGVSMLVPIGAQNSLILNQAIKRNYHLIAATICVVCDVTLMSIGVFGGGELIKDNDSLLTFITWAGIIFLTGYGLLSFKAVFHRKHNKDNHNSEIKSLKVVVATTLAVTLLNPHVYLDTVVIFGSVGSQFVGNEKITFALGMMLASILWFYSLSFAAAKLSEVLSRPRVRQVIDFSVGVVMWLIAYSLLKAT
ncbi:MAG: L-lysine exporter family protein LysE/ArgO [Phenylobacterium sp.]|jgi:L-lysine exporter family protein LysE/ArgO